jgi:hypothetical protein
MHFTTKVFSLIRQENKIVSINDAWLITYGDIASFTQKYPQYKDLESICTNAPEHKCISLEEFLSFS